MGDCGPQRGRGCLRLAFRVALRGRGNVPGRPHTTGFRSFRSNCGGWLGVVAQRAVSKGSFLKGFFLGNRGLGVWAMALTATVIEKHVLRPLLNQDGLTVKMKNEYFED